MIIAVEGSIGSGKTTMLDRLEEMGYTVVREPIDAWSFWLNGNGDRAFFQCAVLAWYNAVWPRIRLLRNVVIERSPFTSRFVFGCHMQHSDLAGIYKALYDRVMDTVDIDMYVFLCTVPSVCYKRVQQRQQPGDDCITLGRLQQLDDLHWAAVSYLKDEGKRVFVL